jgi:CRISPR-associated protein Cas2
MNMIVAYDIAEPRRLLKVARVMKDYGRRVQKSIFEVEVDEVRFRQMRFRVERIITPAVDGVKYFPLCGRCADTLIALGLCAVFPQEDAVVIL